MGGSGVQRPLKFIKYLPEHGWNPIVLTPYPGAYHTFDESLQQELESIRVEVHRVRAKTPFHATGQKKRKVDFIPDFMAKPLRRLSTFFWLPDNKKGWIQPGIQSGLELISAKNIQAIFSTAPPYSNHLIAQQLKKETGLPTVMDMRDDWLESHLIKYPTPFHKKKMAEMEKKAFNAADIITVINNDTRYAIAERTKNIDKIRLLNQGFDPEDFTGKQPKKDGKLKFLYSGLFYGERTPKTFLRALALFLKSKPEAASEIIIQFQGGIDEYVNEFAVTLGIDHIIKDFGYLPHKKAVQNLEKADVLWLIVGHSKKANQVTVGKMFEYFGAQKPILGLVPDGSSKELLKEYGAGFVCNPNDIEQIKNQIVKIYSLWKQNELPEVKNSFIKLYDRRFISFELAKILNDVSDL